MRSASELSELLTILSAIREKAGVGHKPMMTELPDIIGKLRAASEHMDVARNESKCPDNEVLVQHVRSMRKTLEAIAIGRVTRDRDDLSALLRIQQWAKQALMVPDDI